MGPLNQAGVLYCIIQDFSEVRKDRAADFLFRGHGGMKKIFLGNQVAFPSCENGLKTKPS